MSKKTILLIIPAVAILLCIITKEGCTQEPKYSSHFKGEIVDVANGSNSNIKGVRLIADHSGSMKGYVDFAGLGAANNNIIGTVSTFVNRVSQNFNPQKFDAVCGQRRYNRANDFLDELTQNRAFTNGSSMVWDLINNGVQYASDSTVAVILSDMVLSYGSAAIINNRDLEYNQHHLDGLEGKVITEMTTAKQKGLDVVVIQYLSDFNGKYYYNCQENFVSLSPQRKTNHYIDVKMEKRPYYIMLIGSEDNLKAIVDKECYGTCASMYASFVTESPALRSGVEYTVKANNENIWRVGNAPDKDGGFYSAFAPNEFSSFEISCDGVSLPRYYYKDEYSFVAECKGPARGTKGRFANNEVSATITTDAVNTLNKGKGKIVADIYAVNEWVKESNAPLSDVDVLNDLEGKTWGLEAFFNGINSVYYPSGNSYRAKIGSITINYYVNE